MSFSLSLNANGPVLPQLPDHNSKPLPEPTATQQIRQLAGSGENTNQIAANLAIPVATIETTIGYSISSDPAASSAQTSILAAGPTALIPPLDTRA